MFSFLYRLKSLHPFLCANIDIALHFVFFRIANIGIALHFHLMFSVGLHSDVQHTEFQFKSVQEQMDELLQMIVNTAEKGEP